MEPGTDPGATASSAHPVLAAAGATRVVARRRTVDDLLRLLGSALVVAVGLLLATVAERTMAGLESDVLEALGRVPQPVARLVVAIPQVVVAVLLVGAPIALAIVRRWRTLLLGGAAMVLAAASLSLLEAQIPLRDERPTIDVPGFAADAGWPSSSTLAAFTAVVVVVAPELSRRWVRALQALLALLAVLRVASAGDLPLDLVLAFGVGGVVGHLLLLAVGRTVLALSPDGVATVLRTAGLAPAGVTERDGEPWPYRVELADGDVVLAKVVGQQGWEADRLQRGYRRLRLRGVGDDRPYSTPRRAAAVEAMLSYHARAAGARVPAVRAVGPTGGEDAVLAVEEVRGARMADLPDEHLTDAVLVDAWRQVAALHGALVAHRGLSLDAVLVDEDGRAWLVDLGGGEAAATLSARSVDVVELLAATGARVGPQRAVAAARAGVGDAALVDALPRLVPPVLSRRTRAAVKHVPDGLDPLVDEVARVTGVERPAFVDVERLKPRYLLTGVLLAVAVYVLAPQLASWPDMVVRLRDAEWQWGAVALAASLATYVGAGLGLAGGVPGRVPATQAGVVALASSFVATVAPPGVGQVGLNVRYLQRRGLPTPVAVSASAVKEAAVLLVHVTLLLGFALWVGRSGVLRDELDTLPSGTVLLAVGGGVLALVVGAFAVPGVRRAVRERVVPAVRQSADALKEVASSPAKITQLVIGCALLPLGYGVALYASVQAFGGGATFPTVVLVSLTAGTLATAAPTPGGIGAVEAVLLASLTGVGVASPAALAAVFLYRLVTFWLPIAPGAVAFRWLVARKVL